MQKTKEHMAAENAAEALETLQDASWGRILGTCAALLHRFLEPNDCFALTACGCLACCSLTPALSPQRRNPTREPNVITCPVYQRIANMSENNAQPPDTHMEMNDELDHTVDDEIKQDATQLETDAMNLDGTNDAEPAAVNGVVDSAAAFEARIPAKKDATLREFLGKMDEYAPIVCDYPPPLDQETWVLTISLDTRCRDQLLPDTRWSTATTPDISTSCAPACARDPEVHRRHCSRRLPVFPHPFVKHYEQ